MTTLIQRSIDVANEMQRRMALCTIAQGAETDIGQTIFQGRRRAVDDDLVPCSVLIEGDDDVMSAAVYTTAAIEQHYVWFAYLRCDVDKPNIAAHAAVRDMKRVIFTADGEPDPRWGDRVRAVRYMGREFAPRSDGAGLVCVAMEIAVSFVENLCVP